MQLTFITSKAFYILAKKKVVSQRERQTYKTNKCLTGGSRIHRAFYIILLDNFMGPTLGERKGGGEKKKKANHLKALHSGSARPPSPSPSPPHPVICHSYGYFMLIYRVRGWELLRDCVVGRRGKKGGQKLENRGGERGPVFVAFGRAALQFSH